MDLEALKYPIGRFVSPVEVDVESFRSLISDIAGFPEQIRNEVGRLTEAQLDMPYRSGGWTARQVVHHVADSHWNAFARFKLSLTEDKPIVKTYFEDRWAELPDGKTAPVGASLNIIDGVHARWVILLKSLSEAQLKTGFIHPEKGREVTLGETAALYAWHGKHHLGHIKSIQTR